MRWDRLTQNVWGETFSKQAANIDLKENIKMYNLINSRLIITKALVKTDFFAVR